MLTFDQLSFWEKESYMNHAEVVIIGSGIVGLSTAIHIKQNDPSRNVLVLERSYLPFGASTKNAGFACIGSPSEILDDLNHISEDLVYETIAKRWKGLLYLKELLGTSVIDYKELGSHELFDSTQVENYEKCIDRLPYLNDILQDITGIKTVFEPNKNVIAQNGFNGFTKAIQHHAEGQLDIGKMMVALHKKAISLGVQILNNISVKAIYDQRVVTNYGDLSFQQLAICTNGFASDLLPKEDIEPARAQVLITKPISDLTIKGIYHFDAGYYYFRNVGNRILFGGGRNQDIAGERTTQVKTTEKIIGHLEDLLKTKILPDTSFEIEQRWAGIMGVGKSKSPIIKQINSNQYAAVRLGGMGVAIGSLVGKELATLMLE